MCIRDSDWHQAVPPPLREGRRIYVEALRRCFPRFARVQRTNSSALPISAGRWLREYHWQRERLWRWWTALRYPVARKWGSEGQAIQAWVFDTWRRTGRLDLLIEPQARVRQWVRREALLGLWNRASADPRQAVPLLGLATIEIMIRHLESHNKTSGASVGSSTEEIQFQSVTRPQVPSCKRSAVGIGVS